MKIYPSPHQVKSTQKPGFMDIPLAHVEKDFYPQKIVAEISPDFAISKDTYVAPYQHFTSNNFIVFDDKRKRVDLPLRYNNHKYVYEPTGAKEFSPEEFAFSMVVKRQDAYSSAKDYNLRIGILKQTEAEDFAKGMMAIFGDAAYRGISPANVRVNGRDTVPQHLLVSDSENLDWLFIQSMDGTSTKDGKQILKLDKYMNTCCNVWITLTDEGMKEFLETTSTNYKMKASTMPENELGGTVEYEIGKEYRYKAKKNVDSTKLNMGALRVLLDGNKESPIVIIEKTGRGFIILSHEHFLAETNLNRYAPFIYNILVSYHIRGYIKTGTKNLWVTDDAVDYMGSMDVPYRKKHPDVNAKDLVNEVSPDTEIFAIVEHSISKYTVILDQINNKGDIFFKKITSSDPARGADEVTVFTTQKTVMMYKKNQYRIIEDEVHFLTEIDDNNHCYVTVEPFVSSSNRIIVSKPKRLKIEEVDMEYDIYALPIGEDGESDVVIIERKKWKTMGSAPRIATVRVEFKGEPAAYDIRMLGGGIPEGYVDYEMLDIGNIKGRPYRVGVGAIIELPKKYKQYNDRIEDTVNRYKVAADKVYVTYKDE